MPNESNDADVFLITRTFNAPPAVVFAMWTQPEQLPRWLPPAGFTMQFVRADIRTGGSTLFSMSAGPLTMYARMDYEEITSPARLVYTQQFCDENEHVTRHPLAPTWPETMRIMVDFAAEGDGQTRMTLTTDVAGDATDAERATFLAGYAGMTMGWSGSFNQLDAVLAEG